ncbi:MAG: flagellar hook-length control protein FliK [Bacillota bacterium]|nr:flagellar hook-length control protein FliK [Bacillota bacterium]
MNNICVLQQSLSANRKNEPIRQSGHGNTSNEKTFDRHLTKSMSSDEASINKNQQRVHQEEGSEVQKVPVQEKNSEKTTGDMNEDIKTKEENNSSDTDVEGAKDVNQSGTAIIMTVVEQQMEVTEPLPEKEQELTGKVLQPANKPEANVVAGENMVLDENKIRNAVPAENDRGSQDKAVPLAVEDSSKGKKEILLQQRNIKKTKSVQGTKKETKIETRMVNKGNDGLQPGSGEIKKVIPMENHRFQNHVNETVEKEESMDGKVEKSKVPFEHRLSSNQMVLERLSSNGIKTEVDNPNIEGTTRSEGSNKEIFDQIVKKIELFSRDNNTEMKIQLKPEHLGKMTIKVVVEEGVVTAKFFTENHQVKHLLEANLNQLKQTLEANGLKVEKTEVNVQLDQGGQFGGFQQQQENSGQRFYQPISENFSTSFNEDYEMDSIAEEMQLYEGTEYSLSNLSAGLNVRI